MAYAPEIMGDDYTGYGDAARKKADARRIVACVNACAGIPTETLESSPIELERWKAVYTDNVKLFAQREELIEVLKEVVNGNDLAHERGLSLYSWPTSDLRRHAREAISKAEAK